MFQHGLPVSTEHTGRKLVLWKENSKTSIKIECLLIFAPPMIVLTGEESTVTSNKENPFQN